MTYCEVCKEEIRNDEWREHCFSEYHLEKEQKKYCKICETKYSVVGYAIHMIVSKKNADGLKLVT